MTCKDCDNYQSCTLRNTYVYLDVKVMNLIADNFTCFIKESEKEVENK